MRTALFLFLISISGVAFALLGPDALDWLLLAGPSALASLIILIRIASGVPPGPGPDDRPRVIVDGSNVMYWSEGKAQIDTLREVIAALHAQGLTPGVVFDANAGYKLTGRYLHDRALGILLDLPRERVMIVPRGEPADPTILTAARDHGARVVSNDRFRDWAETFPEIGTAGKVIRGGYRNGKLWMDFTPPVPPRPLRPVPAPASDRPADRGCPPARRSGAPDRG